MMAFRRPKSLQDYLARAKLRRFGITENKGFEHVSVKISKAMFVIMLLRVMAFLVTQRRKRIL